MQGDKCGGKWNKSRGAVRDSGAHPRYLRKSETSGRSSREEKSHSALGRLASSTLIYIKIMCEGMKILWMSGQTDNEKYFLCEAELLR